MDSVELFPQEFWFYRVYSELTLALLHQVNNELTGALFLTELIQDDVEMGTHIGDKSSDLETSIRKVIQLNEQITDAHFPDMLDVGGISNSLEWLPLECVPMLRLLLPKTVAIRMDTPFVDFPTKAFPRKEIPIIFAAVGLLLNPAKVGTIGELAITFDQASAELIFLPNYLAKGLHGRPAEQPGESPGFLALRHRMDRLGGSIEIGQNPAMSFHQGIRLAFSKN